MSEQQKRDWRGINVRRNRKYEHLVDLFCTRRSEVTGRPIFEFIKDLMVFAAMVGYTSSKKEPVFESSIQIILGTYASDEKDGYIYLLGLLESQDVYSLKDESLINCIKVFEEYCNGGLSTIDDWLSENPQDLEGTSTLVDKIVEELSKLKKDDEAFSSITPKF